MRRFSVPIVAALFVAPSIALAQATPPAPQTLTLSGNGVRSYNNIERDLLNAAEKMLESDYAFKPAADSRPFGQLVAHVALSQFGACALLRGDAAAPHRNEKEEAPRSKASLIALFKESTAYCDPVLTTLRDEDMAVLVDAGPNRIAKGLFLLGAVVHGNEVYGTMAVYLRMKGIVPPSTERQNAAKTRSK